MIRKRINQMNNKDVKKTPMNNQIIKSYNKWEEKIELVTNPKI